VTHQYKLSEATVRLINETIMALNAEQEEHQGIWDGHQTETWQESERGTTVAAWIEELGDLADQLDALEGKP
jgi:hypothetical protein